MYRLRNAVNRFMYGRYCRVDSLQSFLMVVFALLCVVNATVRSGIVSGLILLIICMMTFRVFSKNAERRYRENMKFIKICSDVKIELKLIKDKIKYRKTNRFIRCVDCKAIIKVPYKKGEHMLKCPKCGNDFNVKI